MATFMENPDGEISTVTKPPPIVLPTAPTLPDISPIPSPSAEPLTILHVKRKRRSTTKNGYVTNSSSTVDVENDLGNEQKVQSIKQKDVRREIKLCINAILTEIVIQEEVDTCLNELASIVSVVHELVDTTVFTDISEKETIILAQDLTNCHETDTEGSILPTNESDQDFINETEILNESISMNDVLDEINTSLNLQNIDENDPQSTTISIDNEQPTMTNSTDAIVEHIPVKEDTLTCLNINDTSIDHLDIESTQEDVLTPVTVNEDAKSVSSESQIDDVNETDDESSILTNIDSTSAVQNNVDTEPNEYSNLTMTKINTIENELPTSTVDTEETDVIILGNTSKTLQNEFEDSFEEVKSSDLSKQQSTEEILDKSTSLAELRQFLSKIDNDSDTDEDLISSKHKAQSTDEIINKLSESKDIVDLVEETLLSSISSHSTSIITSEYFINDSSSDDEFISDINDKRTSTITSEEKIIEKKRFPAAYHHSIPPGTKISHMTCSSTYIYMCTTDWKIFYAKLNHDDLNLPLKWQQHSDFAERLVVSITNRTVWRLWKKRLYSSNDSIKLPPIGSQWNEIKLESILLSMSINDQCGWYIKQDGSLWLVRTNDDGCQPLNVACPFDLNTIFCFAEKVGVTTSSGEIMIRVGCTNDCLEGDGWIFIDHNFGPIDDFVLLTNKDTIFIVDKKHHLWIHQWSSDKGFFEVLCDDDSSICHQRYITSVNSAFLCLTDCEEKLQVFSDCLTGIQWKVIKKNTRLQRLIGAFFNEDHVWALNTDRMICTSNGQILEKPRQAQYITHATFVPNNFSANTILWSLDESCNIYVRPNVDVDTPWEQLNQTQFEWSRRLVHMICNNAGVWAVDDRGLIHFRHGHISASQYMNENELTLLPPAWITIPGDAKRHRYFSQVFCGPADWMVYATDNKQNVYARFGINEENRVGTSWKPIEDCSALELAISEHTLWLLTSCGEIQCRENISLTNPIGTRSTTLSGHFLSLTVSMDDSQVWALDSKRNLLKLDRLTVLFEK
ncbi:hypothetical protein I4U23_019486 [Adineta vaga]|nr:hypothetical protein I4U23_019486 [Adineta vaga]